MPKKKKTAKDHWIAGYDEGVAYMETEMKDITAREFAWLAHKISQDWRLDHKEAGQFIYKLSLKVDENVVRLHE